MALIERGQRDWDFFRGVSEEKEVASAEALATSDRASDDKKSDCSRASNTIGVSGTPPDSLGVAAHSVLGRHRRTAKLDVLLGRGVWQLGGGQRVTWEAFWSR